jgi:hypothetical protein
MPVYLPIETVCEIFTNLVLSTIGLSHSQPHLQRSAVIALVHLVLYCPIRHLDPH